MSGKCEATVSPYAGLKSTCRHITSQDSGPDKIHFVVGTSVVGKTNQIQVIEYDDMHANIQCIQTLEHPDEIWWITCHPRESDLMATISQNAASRSTTTSLFRVPEPDALSEKQSLEKLATFQMEDPVAKRICYWPAAQKCFISCTSSVNVFDVERTDKPLLTISTDDQPLHAAAADPLHENIVAGCVGNTIKLWDINSGDVVHEIPNAHGPDALDVNFNENKAWWIATGGSDGFLRCWDVRVGKAACEFRASSHWVTRVVPSVSHEQLILTTGTDSKVRVFNASEFAFQNEGKLKDGEILKSIRHDDSVYCACWAASNPWVFASVSYKGQVNVCQLPSEVVESILMGDDSD